MTDTERLRERYDGAVEAAPDTLLTLEAAETLHLAARGRDGPACHDSEPREWRRVKTRDALSFGAELCGACFRMHFEHLSRDPSSPVERVDTETEPEVESVARTTADGGRPVPLSAQTERVARVSGSSSVYHAPTQHGALCGVDADVTVEREILEGHYRSCRDCFDVEEG